MAECKNCKKKYNKNTKYCSLKCRNLYVNKRRDYTKVSNTFYNKRKLAEEVYNSSPSICKNCKSKLPFSKRNNKFCKSSCATIHTNSNRNCSYNLSKVAHNNIKKAGIRRFEKNKNKYRLNPNRCVICNDIIAYEKRTNKTCSTACKIELLSIRSSNNPNCGGSTPSEAWHRPSIHEELSELCEVISSIQARSLSLNPDLAELADQALASIDTHQQENIDEWAERLMREAGRRIINVDCVSGGIGIHLGGSSAHGSIP